MDAYIITLPGEDARLSATMHALQPYMPWLDLYVCVGQDGREASKQLIEGFGGDPRYPGRFGCMLSHALVWQTILHSHVGEENEYRLVLEDDANPHDVDKIVNAEAGHDLVLVNDRAHSLRKEHDHGLGTDGYLLTPIGAKRLLELLQRDGYGGHLDGRIAQYIKTNEIDAIRLGYAITEHENLVGPRQRFDMGVPDVEK